MVPIPVRAEVTFDRGLFPSPHGRHGDDHHEDGPGVRARCRIGGLTFAIKLLLLRAAPEPSSQGTSAPAGFPMALGGKRRQTKGRRQRLRATITPDLRQMSRNSACERARLPRRGSRR